MPLCRLAVAFCVALVLALSNAVASAQTTSAGLKAAIKRAMAGQKGTAVVVSVESGQIVAAYHLAVATQRTALPGSSIKPFTLIALLNSGKLDAQTTVLCKRALSIEGHRLDCSHPPTGQPLDAATALAYSCNSYFTSMAARLTPAEFRDALVRRGFAAPTGMVPDEAVGTVALAHSPDELKLQAIGEWGVDVTPLELLRAYRNLALMPPENPDPQLTAVFKGLEGSTSYGMARSAQPQTGMRVAGKTGTVHSREGAWTHGWFSGYGPANKPAFAVVVFVEKGRGADAAEIASHIFAALSPSDSAKSSVIAGRKP